MFQLWLEKIRIAIKALLQLDDGEYDIKNNLPGYAAELISFK